MSEFGLGVGFIGGEGFTLKDMVAFIGSVLLQNGGVDQVKDVVDDKIGPAWATIMMDPNLGLIVNWNGNEFCNHDDGDGPCIPPNFVSTVILLAIQLQYFPMHSVEITPWAEMC